MIPLSTIAVLIAVFFIGLNLGLHGLISFKSTVFTGKQLQKEPITTTNVKDNENNVGIPEEALNTVELDRGFVRTHEAIQPFAKTLSGVLKSREDQLTSNVKPFEVAPLKLLLNNVDRLIDEFVLTKGMKPLAVNTYQKDIPILLLTCNRPTQLRDTLDSLLLVKGVKKHNILVSQDGALAEVSHIVRSYGLDLLQNVEGVRLRGGAANDGASRIAQHYKFSLSAAFDRNPTANSVIIVEDDLLFSPDFYEFLVATAPVLDLDPTAFVVSAWSDNGFKNHVKDPFALRRTDYFPGLGWLLTRKLYKSELERAWPASHWDHWLRSPEISKHRDIIYPQVPRTYHNGIQGTFMNLDTHNKYFRDIGYNTDPRISWPTATTNSDNNDNNSNMIVTAPRNNYLFVEDSVFEYRTEQLIASCQHISSVAELVKFTGKLLCIWIDISTDCERQPVAFEPVASFFGLWHEHRRGNHHGVHEFYWEIGNNYVLLINVREEGRNPFHSNSDNNNNNKGSSNSYRHLMPRTVLPIQRSSDFNKALLLEGRRKRAKIATYKATERGMNCNQVCKQLGKVCDAQQLPLLNTCEAMKEQYPCNAGCTTSRGGDQPAYVALDASAQYLPGTCLINKVPEQSTCEATHLATYRLCACK